VTLRFTTNANKRRIPHEAVWRVIVRTRPRPITTDDGQEGLWYEGDDGEGLELEVITVPLFGGDELVIHVMPTSHRHRKEGR
jgi:hypothetical protein